MFTHHDIYKNSILFANENIIRRFIFIIFYDLIFKLSFYIFSLFHSNKIKLFEYLMLYHQQLYVSLKI